MREVFRASDRTTVHMKDGVCGKDAFLPGRPAAAAPPVLHWTEAGRTIRGGTRVLEHVAISPRAGPPGS